MLTYLQDISREDGMGQDVRTVEAIEFGLAELRLLSRQNRMMLKWVSVTEY